MSEITFISKRLKVKLVCLFCLMPDMDLEETYGTGNEQDVDEEILDGFYHQNVAFKNEKVQLFGNYWMNLYSNWCLQRDYTVGLQQCLRYMKLTVILLIVRY